MNEGGKKYSKPLLPGELVNSGFEHGIKKTVNGRNLTMTLLLWGSENEYNMR